MKHGAYMKIAIAYEKTLVNIREVEQKLLIQNRHRFMSDEQLLESIDIINLNNR